jgi:hypothetical protein
MGSIKTRQNTPIDTGVPIRHKCPIMSKMQNQLSQGRLASIIVGAAKFRMLFSFIAAIVSSAFVFTAGADGVVITSLGSNGALTWSNNISNAVYSVQWAPSLTSTWSASWGSLKGLPATPGAFKTLSVPMYYRIMANTNKNILLSDDFADGNDQGWFRLGGNWSVTNGQYIAFIGTSSNCYSLAGSQSWSNYTYRASVKAEHLNNDFGLVFNAQGTNDFMRFTMSGVEGPRISHMKRVNGDYDSQAELAQIVSTPSLQPNTWHTFQVVTHSGNVFAFVDDELVAYAIGLPFATGLVGLMTDEPNIACDEILVVGQ